MASVMDKVLRKNKADSKRDWTASGSFINKPATGWLHSDADLSPNKGVKFIIIYVGCMQIKESMKTLDFETRTAVAKESISRVCEAAKLKSEAKRHKRNAKVTRLLGDQPNMLFAGSNIILNISIDRLTLKIMETQEIIGNHEMPGISFASGGDPDTMDFVAYVAKDEMFGRACHVLECGGGLAQDVITTIGQAFELRYKMYLANKPSIANLPERQIQNGDAWGNDSSDRDYYNDRPNAQPPDLVQSDLVPPAYADNRVTATNVTAPSAPGVGDQHRARESSGINIAEEARCLEVYDNPLKEDDASGIVSKTPNGSSPQSASVSVKEMSEGNVSHTPVDLMNPPVPDIEHQLARCSVQTNIDQPATSNQDSDQVSSRPMSSSLSTDGSWSQGLSHMSSGQQQVHASGGILPYNEPWFHGKISRQRVEQLLKADGDFLVRESSNSPGQFVLSGKHSGKIKHLLLVDPEGVVRTKDRTFDSISHLINHHMNGRIPISSSDSELRLLYPVVKNVS